MRALRWSWPILLLLVGCATSRPWLPPLSPASLGDDRLVRQQLLFVRDDQTRSLQVMMRLRDDTLTLVGLSALGQRLFTLVSDGREVELTSRSQTLEELEPNWILTELQLVHWPLRPLRRALPRGLRLEQQGAIRTLWRDEALLWFSVTGAGDPDSGDIAVYNLHLGYRLIIRRLKGDDKL